MTLKFCSKIFLLFEMNPAFVLLAVLLAASHTHSRTVRNPEVYPEVPLLFAPNPNQGSNRSKPIISTLPFQPGSNSKPEFTLQVEPLAIPMHVSMPNKTNDAIIPQTQMMDQASSRFFWNLFGNNFPNITSSGGGSGTAGFPDIDVRAPFNFLG